MPPLRISTRTTCTVIDLASLERSEMGYGIAPPKQLDVLIKLSSSEDSMIITGCAGVLQSFITTTITELQSILQRMQLTIKKISNSILLIPSSPLLANKAWIQN